MKKSADWDRSFRPATYWPEQSGAKEAPVMTAYLAELEPGEAEIARIQMLSTLGDVISLRAKRDAAGGIHYRFCDEYPEDEKVYEFSPVASDESLTFGEIVDLLDGARCSDSYEPEPRLIWGILRMNLDSGLDNYKEIERFITVASAFYPQLTEYFRWRIRQWIAAWLRDCRH